MRSDYFKAQIFEFGLLGCDTVWFHILGEYQPFEENCCLHLQDRIEAARFLRNVGIHL
jgi:hypothetical protein